MEIVSASLPAGLGATLVDGGVKIAVFSRNADRVLFCAFDERGEREIARLALPDRSGDIHHGFLPGLDAGALYGLRAEGRYEPAQGAWFDPNKLLIDPYASEIDRPFVFHAELSAPASADIDTARWLPKCKIVPAAATATHREQRPALVYELAVRSYSMRDPAIPEKIRGTLAALSQDKVIAHLQQLGVSHVELMPVAAWLDERHLPELGLRNAWGYNPVNFFALDPRLAPGGAADLQDLCARYRREGIGVILDVVFNHTAESDELGPTVCFRGLDNAVYYRHHADDPGKLVNDTGCGNTVALDRAPVVRMAMDAMRHLRLCGVAGFRFDLAPVMGRTDQGFSPDAPLLGAMAQDPDLKDVILIAEPWDIGPGGYQLGQFPPPFGEWNSEYRDDVRRFWRGDAGLAGALATRLAGSSNLFQNRHRGPSASVNYLSSHDGFTLADIVSYTGKHNLANGEDNRDGQNENFSWNCGVEGVTDEPTILENRRRDIRAMLASLFVSRGTPMLQAGDEGGRSQGGNNNAYAQDEPAFWLDWPNMDAGLIGFTAALAKLRKEWPSLEADRFFTGSTIAGKGPDVTWLGTDGHPLDPSAWGGANALAMLIDEGPPGRLLIAFNRASLPVPFVTPTGTGWRLRLCSAEMVTDGPIGDVLPARSVRVFVEG